MHNLTKIIAGLLMLLGLSLGIYAWVLSRSPAVAPPAENATQAATSWPLVVAARPLAAGAPIKAEDLRVERLTVRASGAYTTVSAVVGQIPAADIAAGMPVSEQNMAMGMALKVADGERAVALKVDEVVGVGHRIRPGDFVDVFLVIKRDATEIGQSKARLLLSRKKVLAYGAASVDAMPATPASPGVTTPKPAEAARTAVLAVPLEEVNALALAESAGKLLLALRNPSDTMVPEGKAARNPSDRASAGVQMADVTLQNVRTASGMPVAVSVPVRAAAAPARKQAGVPNIPGDTVEVIRGAKRETVPF